MPCALKTISCRAKRHHPPLFWDFSVRKYIIPYDLDEKTKENVISHERAHIRRGDHFIKTVGFLLLAVYWFNPLIWVAYTLLCRDIELACDEKVVREMDGQARRSYAEALLKCGADRRIVSACPLAFGEVGVKERIRGVMSYKKPALWITVAAVMLGIIIAVCFLTDPMSDSATQNSAVDLSDIADMNIGAEMPDIIYADGNKVIMQGTFGATVYDMQKEKVTDRISYDTLGGLEIEFLNATSYVDGKTLFLSDMNDEHIKITYTYSLSDRKFRKYETEETDFFECRVLDYEETIILGHGRYLIGAYATGAGEDLIYLRSEDWSVSSLEIVRGDKVYKVFSDIAASVVDTFEVKAENFVLTGEEPHIRITVKNNTDGEIILPGGSFNIYRLGNDDWASCEVEGRPKYDQYNYIKPGGSLELTCYLDYFDISRVGEYKITLSYFDENEYEQFKGIYFTVGENGETVTD